MLLSVSGLAAAVLISAAQAAPPPAPPPLEAPSPVTRVVDGVWLIEGSIRPGRGPDGNTVILVEGDRVVVVDTGRNPWHQASIFAWMQGNALRPTAIVNTHWHLDHATGNIALKDRYPGLQTWAGDGMNHALSGILAQSLARNRTFMASDRGTPIQRQNAARSLAALEQGERLTADVLIESGGRRSVGGLDLDVFLSVDAASESDVWLRDPRTGTMIVGDLITLPSPFLDTACVQGWRDAMDAIAAETFERLIPGHGPVMTRADFDLYHRAFDLYIDCAGSVRPAEACGAEWAQLIAPLLGDDAFMNEAARSDGAEYVRDLLRLNGGNAASCRTAQMPNRPAA